MSNTSKEVDGKDDDRVIEEVTDRIQELDHGEEDEESEEDEKAGLVSTEVAGESAKPKKKKKSKKAKLKKAFGLGSQDDQGASSGNPASKLTPGMVEQLLEMNPSLKGEVAGMSREQAAEVLKKLDVADLLTGMSVSGKNQKDMASYKFWQTQPVPRFDEPKEVVEGPIKVIDKNQVSKEPRSLYDGFEWVTMDLDDEKEASLSGLTEVHELLTAHYVEDNDAKFRLTYSSSFLNWALKSPGWRKEWHVGVRASQSKKLVAFISGVPVDLRVKEKVLKSTEINFLCIHKKLRSKRLAPVLIEEITRRCYLSDIHQAIYTAGVVLPKPISSCRYFHRPLDWLKLYDVGFSGMPPSSTKARQVAKNHVPSATAVPGLRPMQKKDVDAVHQLLQSYLNRFQLAPRYNEEEVDHWLLHDEKKCPEQVVWTYVVEDPTSHEITDFFSFYCLDSAVIGHSKIGAVKAAYLFYYASQTAFAPKEKGLKDRLNALVLDALVLAKKLNFDVFNALTLLDNPLFLEQQKFGAGDGQLHYYLYNYRSLPIPGGVDARNNVDEKQRGGIGVVML